jgi:hypothetical protein
MTTLPHIRVGSVLRRSDGRRFVVKAISRRASVPAEARKAIEPRFSGFSSVAVEPRSSQCCSRAPMKRFGTNPQTVQEGQFNATSGLERSWKQGSLDTHHISNSMPISITCPLGILK